MISFSFSDKFFTLFLQSVFLLFLTSFFLSCHCLLLLFLSFLLQCLFVLLFSISSPSFPFSSCHCSSLVLFPSFASCQCFLLPFVSYPSQCPPCLPSASVQPCYLPSQLGFAARSPTVPSFTSSHSFPLTDHTLSPSPPFTISPVPFLPSLPHCHHYHHLSPRTFTLSPSSSHAPRTLSSLTSPLGHIIHESSPLYLVPLLCVCVPRLA